MSEEHLSPGSNGGAGEALAEQVPVQLAGDLRRLKRWLIVLTVLVVLLIAAMVVSGILVSRAIDDRQQSDYGVPLGPTADQVTSTRQEIEAAFGDRLAGLETRLVTMEFDDPLMVADTPGEQLIYVQYRLKDSDVLVADLLGAPSAPTRPRWACCRRGAPCGAR